MEKSKVSADYISERKKAATAAGSAAAASEDSNRFGGLDLSQISDRASTSSSMWNEDMPSMLYNPEDELSKAEQEEVDPVMKKNAIQQALNELSNAKWPDFASAGREVALMLAVIAFSAVLIIGWDKFLRGIYTTVGFIPSAEDLKNYAQRFDGLDLPSGWTDNMSDQDVVKLADKVSQATSTSGLPGL
jgi:hypothetical protein